MIQKLYQKITVGISGSDVRFNIYSTLFSLCVFAVSGGLHIDVSLFSVINALLKAVCGLLYLLIGFKILARGNVALYMLFLMSGGMVVPCVFGWLFLGEKATFLTVLGACTILFSVVLANSGAKRPDKKLLILCVSVFILNGFVSVFSKLHQIGAQYGYDAVDTSSYALISTIFSLAMSCGLLFRKKENKDEVIGDNAATKKSVLIPILIVLAYSIAGSVSSLFQLEGAKNLPASVLYPVITGGSIALSAVFGMILFKEHLTKRAWLGIILCFAGTCMFV